MMAESSAEAADSPQQTEHGAESRKVFRQEQQQPRLCRFFSRGRYCQFGKRCYFLHERATHSSVGKKSESSPAEIPVQPSIPNTTNANVPAPGLTPQHGANLERRYRPRRLCRYFASGYCSLESNCRFWHPETHPPVNDNHFTHNKPVLKNTETRKPVSRPAVVPEEMKPTDVTPELANQLRQTEISQLLKRFPKDKVIIQEREDGKVTYYRVSVEPTDPDWPFDLKEMEIMLEFPDNYPLQIFNVQIPEDQVLPSVMCRHVCEASQAWLDAKHATNQLIGKVEILFRPYLLWLDRNMERLFTEGARQLKRDLDAEKAGIEFVPYQQLQVAVQTKSSVAGNHDDGNEQQADLQEDEDSDDDSESWTSCDDDEEDDDDDDEEHTEEDDTQGGMRLVEGGTGEIRRKGTEIQFLGLHLAAGVATLQAHRITVSLQCIRCKETADLSMTEKQPCVAQCERCNSRISVTFHSTIMHQYASVLGYVDIQGALPRDLILQDSVFAIGCLGCSQEGPLQNLSYGITKDMNCLNCHCKLSVSTEATKFQKVERPRKIIGNRGLNYGKKKAPRDPAIQPGKPLPDNGTCKHYKKSCRWLRFPCCGKTYPCDICHDEVEDHEMELAARMICGYCAKEQAYTNSKPCISCGNMLSKAFHSVHWEGGKGCRNRIKMSRKDKQKYANTSKTVSRKNVGKK
uniref:Nucleoporin NUP42 n=1 Tax=Leptobrachium leishanense TaxID=445787 RepID=A0A8C5MAE1_9ANUR